MTTATIRPNGTISQGGAGGSGAVASATTLHGDTSDSSDATYITTTAWTSYSDPQSFVWLSLGTFTLPAGAVTKTVALSGRAAAVTTSTVGVATLRRPSGEAICSYRIGNDTTSFIESGTGQVPATLTQADIDGLWFSFLSEFDVPAMEIAEIFVDVVYVPVPVTAVTAVSPDPYTASNIIPISWSNTLNADGGAQTRYRLKVFTAAQYGAGGFDPESSSAFYDSGEVVSAAGSANTGVLDNGTTYRAYVKVAQTVNGSAHWSAWAYDQFAVSVTTSDVDTVVAAGSNPTASIAVTVARDTGSAAWNFVEVQRSIDNGATWSPVRGATYVAATGNTFTVTDYEVGNGVATLYRARATRIVSDLPITGAWVQSSPSSSWSSNACWLKAPDDPSLNTTFWLLRRDQYSRRRPSGVFQVVGAATPVVVSDVLTKRSGVLSIETYESTEAADIIAILDGAAVVLVQLPALFDVADFYAAIVNVEEVFVSTVADVVWRRWAAGYVEVDAPADPDASAP